MPKTFLIIGASGLVGSHIADALIKRGDEYIALTHSITTAKKNLSSAKKIVPLNDYLSLKDEKIDAVINLAGKSIGDKRWNEKVKKEISDSRIDSTLKIVELISQMKSKPNVLVSASGVDYYGDRGAEDVFEDTPNANTFMGKLCRDWEREAMKAEQYGVRVAVIRTGFVLAKNAEAVKRLSLPYKLFIGGPIGNGKQYMSWIHIDDLVGIYLYSADNLNVNGPVNAAAPNPQTMKEFGKNLGKAIGKPSWLPVPAFAVKIGVGEMAQIILTGRRALPEKIMALGYKFKFVHSIDAWKDVFA